MFGVHRVSSAIASPCKIERSFTELRHCSRICGLAGIDEIKEAFRKVRGLNSLSLLAQPVRLVFRRFKEFLHSLEELMPLLNSASPKFMLVES